MRRIVPIVEGHGEVAALPILIRRIATALDVGQLPDVRKPIRVGRQRILKQGELERTAELGANTAGPGGALFILLDADDDCAVELADQIAGRTGHVRSDVDVATVIAVTEYEAWFLAAIESIAGKRKIASAANGPTDPEAISKPKRWLSRQMPRDQAYRETIDQPALTQAFDLEAARSARSFRKLWKEVSRLLIPAGE